MEEVSGRSSPVADQLRPEAEVIVARSFRAVCDEVLYEMEKGHLLNRSGESYKPSAYRSARYQLSAHVWDQLGHLPIEQLTRRKIQDVIDAMVKHGLAPSTIRNVAHTINAK